VTRWRFHYTDLLFALLLALGIAAGIYHAASDRYANGVIVIGAVLVGLFVLWTDPRRTVLRKGSAPSQE
jgi:hypothetical protein